MSSHENKIGTRNESSLHRTLKFRYTGEGGRTEVASGEYVADGVSKDGEFIEVQTGSFAPLKNKVKEFASCGKVRIIHPIAIKKTIEVYKPGGKGKPEKLLYRRKSPKTGTLWELFDALLYAPLLPLTSGLTIEAALIDTTEKRLKDGKGSWRRKGISLVDKELAAWHESVLFKKPSDYLRFIPFKKNEEFTSATLARKAGINADTARVALYVLTKMGLLERTGKKGNSWIYSLKNSRRDAKYFRT